MSHQPRGVALRRIFATTLAAVAAVSTFNFAAPAPQAQALDLAGLVNDNPLNPKPAKHHAGAPTPRPFAPERMTRIYQSDNSITGQAYFYVVDDFNNLRHNRKIMKQNLDTVVATNQAARENKDLQQRSLDDAHEDLMITMSNGMGQNLGGHFRTAVKEGRLPKTSQLLAGTLARGGGIASSTFIEKYYFNYNRPYVAAPQRITKYHRAGEDTYDGSPAFPSGHTNQATWKSTIMAVMMPELGPQLLARGSEVGYSRQVLGVHYPLDVIGGRMMGTAAATDRMRDPLFRQMITEARNELRAELEWRCGTTLEQCIASDVPYLSTSEAVSVYTERMTYGFPQIKNRNNRLMVPGYSEVLLKTAFPNKSVDQRRAVLFQTAIPAGYPLDNQSGTGSWQRLNMAAAFAAAQGTAQGTAPVTAQQR